jgi:hypothetical protein
VFLLDVMRCGIRITQAGTGVVVPLKAESLSAALYFGM